ncbi:MAG: MarR family transcriptional regulator [Clostridia bacterium]|nr:MarR family transcriptional regulator [Clostridia bacterium]
MEQDRFLRFSSLLNEAQKSIARLKHIKMESYGLGSAHTVCIRILQDHPDGVTKSDLAKLCSVDKAQISRVIADLLQKEYVAVSTPERNYRQKYTLTEQGKSVADEMSRIILEINRFVSSDIPQEQLDIFYATFNTICEKLNEAEKLF